jgi:hypothetical protein
MLSPLMLKTTLTVRAADQEKFCLDPRSRPEERTISQYHAHVSADLPLDRQKIHATVPFGKIPRQPKGLSSYYIYLMNACLLSPELKRRVERLEESNTKRDDTIGSMQDTLSSMQDTLHSMKMETLNLYIGNMLVDFIEKIYQKRGQSLPPGAGNDPPHSTT